MSISFSFLKVISESDIRFYDTPMNGDRIKYYISQRTAKTYHEPLYVPYITIHRFIYVLSRCAFVNGYLIRIISLYIQFEKTMPNKILDPNLISKSID